MRACQFLVVANIQLLICAGCMRGDSSEAREVNEAPETPGTPGEPGAPETDEPDETDMPNEPGEPDEPDDACVPECANRVCGNDGCGGSCGACPSGDTCDTKGQCTCVPECAGRQCGDNGCGGLCGTCPDSIQCDVNGRCGDVQGCATPQITVQISTSSNAWWQQISENGNALASLSFEVGGESWDMTDEAFGWASNHNVPFGTQVRLTAQTAASDTYASGDFAWVDGGAVTLSCGGACVPDCLNRQCGTNGCGGQCGTCETNQTCDNSGQCVEVVCEPNCTNRVCGDDGCGGSCGTCSPVLFCGGTGQCGEVSETETMKVVGNRLQDACGEEVILKGVNRMFVWMGVSSDPTCLQMLADSGANTVRIVANNEEGPSFARLRSLLEGAIDRGLVPILENHSGTCGAGDSASVRQSIVNWWIRPEMVSLLMEPHIKRHVIVNFANELGGAGANAQTWVDWYTAIVPALRNGGIADVPIMIDLAFCGRRANYLAQPVRGGKMAWKNLIEDVDADHNLIFSTHFYGWAWGDVEATTEDGVRTWLGTAVDSGAPLFIGEFAGANTSGPYPYKTMLDEAARHGVGYAAWSMDRGNSDDVQDMIVDRTCAGGWRTSLPWVQDVVFDHPNALKTAKRSYLLVNGTCAPE